MGSFFLGANFSKEVTVKTTHNKIKTTRRWLFISCDQQLAALTFTAVQAGQATIHDDGSFGITFLTKLGTCWEASGVHF